MVKVTIITPTLNHGRFIEETIQSVARQRYADLEYIIVDGGSSDNTSSVVKQYEKHVTTFISERDNGQSAAINRAISMSTGEIITWLNSDDMLTHGAVARAVQALESRSDVDIVYSDFLDIDEMHRTTVVSEVKASGPSRTAETQRCASAHGVSTTAPS